MADIVTIRCATGEDAEALIAANLASRMACAPWVEPFTDRDGFDRWFADTRTGRAVAFIAEAEGAIAGLVTLGDIVHGNSCCASVSYYAMAGRGGRGLMTRAVEHALAHAFTGLGLHRVEADLQPGNLRARRLVQRLGFRLEGYAPRFRRVAGVWRDHERWARLADEDMPDVLR